MTGMSERGASPTPQIKEQLTLFNSGGRADYALKSTTRPPGFSDLPTSLRYYAKMIVGFYAFQNDFSFFFLFDPSQDTPGICKNEGICVPSCDESPFYYCDCNPEWEGRNCTIKVSFRYFLMLFVAAHFSSVRFTNVKCCYLVSIQSNPAARKVYN